MINQALIKQNLHNQETLIKHIYFNTRYHGIKIF